MQPMFFIIRKRVHPSLKGRLGDLLFLSLCLALPLLAPGCDSQPVISPESQDPSPHVQGEVQENPPPDSTQPAQEEAQENPIPNPESVIADRYAVCAGCHQDHHRLWENGGHHTVGCEACHGPADGHTEEKADPRPKMELRGEARLCLSCHAKSRPMINNIPRIESLEAHVKFVGEKHKVNTDLDKVEGKCVFCHEPHSLE